MIYTFTKYTYVCKSTYISYDRSTSGHAEYMICTNTLVHYRNIRKGGRPDINIFVSILITIDFTKTQ